MSRDGLHNWRIAAVVALVVIVLAIPLYVARELQRDDAAPAMPEPREDRGDESPSRQ